MILVGFHSQNSRGLLILKNLLVCHPILKVFLDEYETRPFGMSDLKQIDYNACVAEIKIKKIQKYLSSIKTY